MNGSGDIGGIISKLTENPELMKGLMGIADGLMKGEGGAAKASAPRFDMPENASDEKTKNNGGGARVEENHHSSRHSGEQCVEKHDKCNQKRSDDAENLIRLLIALKPYVGKERCAKIDSIVKILKLIRLSEQSGLLKSLL